MPTQSNKSPRRRANPIELKEIDSIDLLTFLSNQKVNIKRSDVRVNGNSNIIIVMSRDAKMTTKSSTGIPLELFLTYLRQQNDLLEQMSALMKQVSEKI